MSVIALVRRANHGSHFRAYGLRGMAKLIDPLAGVDHAWMSEIRCSFPPQKRRRKTTPSANGLASPLYRKQRSRFDNHRDHLRGITSETA